MIFPFEIGRVSTQKKTFQTIRPVSLRERLSLIAFNRKIQKGERSSAGALWAAIAALELSSMENALQ